MIFDIKRGEAQDINALENLYNDLNDYLASGINYAGWKKGIYPTREEAVEGVRHQTLYVAKQNGEIAGTIILNHKPETAYSNAKWSFESDYTDVFVVHTFAIHPRYMKCGVGKLLLDFAADLASKSNLKAIRLDVFEGNTPAIRLYEKCGYKYVDTVDLGLKAYGLEWFKLYEILI